MLKTIQLKLVCRLSKLDGWMKLVREPWIIAPKNKNKIHGAVFPEELPRRCIVMCSLKGDVVLDPFAGTGTVGTVCKSLERNYILIEIDKSCLGCVHLCDGHVVLVHEVWELLIHKIWNFQIRLLHRCMFRSHNVMVWNIMVWAL